MVLLMSVNPGFGGQKFIQAVLPKIDAMANRIARSGLSVELEVDGGVTVENAAALRQCRRYGFGCRQRGVRQRGSGPHDSGA